MQTTNTVKAVKKTIKVAGLDVDVFQMPDGSYQYSQTSVAKAIGKAESSFRSFLTSKRPEALPCKDSGSAALKVEGNNRAINAVLGEVATAYWSYWSSKGDKDANALMRALADEALTRRADAAFSVTKTEAQYEQATATLRIEIINKAIPEYLQGGEAKAKSLDGLTQDEKELVFKQVTAYRLADQRIANKV